MSSNLYIYGEVLFDHFADGSKVLGGAPFNVAWHLQAFGHSPVFISRVGDDPEGEQVRASMNSWGMDTSALQVDPELPTGKVTIKLINNEPVYDIVSPCAYDAIQSKSLPSLRPADLLYHGSLALRHTHSRETLRQLIAPGRPTVFVDVNLRSPWWQSQPVLNIIGQANWLKLNIDELNELYPAQLPLVDRLTQLIENYQLEAVILTTGSEGARLVTSSLEVFQIQPDAHVHVVDTVGAGDALTAVVILGLLNKWPIQTTLQRAQRFASSIVEQRGATVSDTEFYRPFIESWEL